MIKALINDEIEAVEGYDKAILYFNGNKEVVKKLQEIKEDELEHIRELKKLDFDLDEEEDYATEVK